MMHKSSALRQPVALSNWKMAMSISESLDFVRDFQAAAGRLLAAVDVIICPPFTALYPVAQAIAGSRLQLGAQTVAASTDFAHTGQISAALLADVGCRWVMLGHWEVRRGLGVDDTTVNQQLRLTLAAGLAPILLIGESRDENGSLETALDRHLAATLAGYPVEQAGRLIIVYEPEGAIGVAEPVTPAHVAAGCRFIRDWLAHHWHQTAADQTRLIYGGSVTPDHAAELLNNPHLDGLGASRRGRDPHTFTDIVRQIAQAKAGRS